jgi:hypothetical protein
MQVEHSNFSPDGEQRAIPESAPESFRTKIAAIRERKLAAKPEANSEEWDLLKEFVKL